MVTVGRRRPRASAGAGLPERPPGEGEGEGEGNGDGGGDGEGEEGKEGKALLDMEELKRRMREVEENATRDEEARAEKGEGTGGEEDGKGEGLGDAAVEDIVQATIEYEDVVEDAEVSEVDEDALRMLSNEFQALDKLYVILFNQKTAQEGVYSLSLNGVNIVLAFQEREEAVRYAVMLGAQEFPKSKVGEFAAEELKNFCAQSGFRLGMVPKGSLLTPPEETVEGNLEDWGEGSAGKEKGEGNVSLDKEDVEGLRLSLEGIFGGAADGEDVPKEEKDVGGSSGEVKEGGGGGESGGESGNDDDDKDGSGNSGLGEE